MIVELSSVGTIPKDVKAKFSPSDIDLEDAGRLTNDVLLEGKISRDERGVHFAGKIESVSRSTALAASSLNENISR